MTLTLQERALLVKLFYQNGDFATEALRICRSPGRGQKCVAALVVANVETQVEKDRSQTIGSTSVRGIAATVDQPRSTVHKILRKVLRNFLYKLSLLQQF
ncbi:hypothetical protein TNCV_361741 [Trichonephila clavipes]|nr:hypothetical protein TNCV_361741 [Trichonephila clavipes]